MDYKKIKKSELVTMIKELKEYTGELEEVNKDIFDKIKGNDDYKQKYIELQDENINLVIEMNNIKESMNRKIEEIINTENNETINYLKKRIKQTQNKKQQKYINDLKNYLN